MKKPSDRQRVSKVYYNALAYPNWNTTPDKRWTISVGRPDDGGRQISDQCATPQQAWRSAWEKIEKERT
jgi:hypothetical protein